MAATFNAPVASVLLAVELLLFEWRPRSFIPVVAAVAVATICRGYLLGAGPIFPVATAGMHLTSADEALGAGRRADRRRCWPSPRPGWSTGPRTPSAGCRSTGCGGPRSAGRSSASAGWPSRAPWASATTSSTSCSPGAPRVSLIVGILVVKTLIWSLSLGSGTSGGVLAPVFMIGGALGAAEGMILPHVFPGFWAMLGLAAVVGGVMRSPLTGIMFTLELTHAWPAPAAAADRLHQRLRPVRPGAQAVGPHREDRPPRAAPDPRVLHRPAGDLLRQRRHHPARRSPCRPTRRLTRELLASLTARLAGPRASG